MMIMLWDWLFYSKIYSVSFLWSSYASCVTKLYAYQISLTYKTPCLQVSFWVWLADFVRNFCWALWAWGWSVGLNHFYLPDSGYHWCMRETLGMFHSTIWWFPTFRGQQQSCLSWLSLPRHGKISDLRHPLYTFYSGCISRLETNRLTF